MGRMDGLDVALDIHKEGLNRTEECLLLLHHQDRANGVRLEAEEPKPGADRGLLEWSSSVGLY